MKGKTKLTSKALSLLLSLVMVLTAAGFNLGFSAFATEEQEVNFCVDKMKNLPTDDEFLEEMLKTLPEDFEYAQQENGETAQENGENTAQENGENTTQENGENTAQENGENTAQENGENTAQENGENTAQEKKEKFNTKRSETIVHSDGKTEEVKFNEEEVYKEIQDLVIKLTQDFQGGQAAESVLNFQKQITQTGESKTSRDHSRNLQKADEIYRWVAEHIDYDLESYDAIRKYYGEPIKTQAEWKSQDAYFVFKQKMGVCDGYAKLTNLMMRMAGVPCMYVGSINGSDVDYGHAFNAVYVEDEGRKGWTLLDSCWASPSGSDGDADIKKFLSGETYFHKDNIYGLKDVLLREDKYLNEVFDQIFDEFKIDSTINPSQELINALNEKVSATLKQANENHKDGLHFEKIEFFTNYGQSMESGVLHLKYETDLKPQLAKQVKDKLKELKISRESNEKIDRLKGKTTVRITADTYFGMTPNKKLADLTNEEFNNKIYILSNNVLDPLNKMDDNIETSINYSNEFKKILMDIVYPKLKNIDKELENINSELNNKLKELNEKYSNIATISQAELSLEKTEIGDFEIVGKFNTNLTEEEIKKRIRKQFDEDERNKEKEKEKEESKKLKFAEFFPAFYDKNQSLEDANRDIINHNTHKVSTFETIGFWKDKYRIINDLKLDESSHEGKAKIIVNDRDNEGQTKNLITDKLFEYGLPICVNVFFDPLDKLVLKGDMSIVAGWDTKIKEIDAKDSSKYILEDGVLYERTDVGGNGEKKAILQFYDEAYRTIEYIDTQKAIQDGTFVP